MIVTDEVLLRMKCEDVLPEEVGPLREKLEQGLKESEELGRPGIGLACPQIGIAKNMAIVRIPSRGEADFNVDLVNCRIAKGYRKGLFKAEGCLSFPGKFIDTQRYQEIVVVDNLVEPHSFVATGLFAVCIQHELDHLRGVLLPDFEKTSEELRGQGLLDIWVD
jgi:peptide deformylase